MPRRNAAVEELFANIERYVRDYICAHPTPSTPHRWVEVPYQFIGNWDTDEDVSLNPHNYIIGPGPSSNQRVRLYANPTSRGYEFTYYFSTTYTTQHRLHFVVSIPDLTARYDVCPPFIPGTLRRVERRSGKWRYKRKRHIRHPMPVATSRQNRPVDIPNYHLAYEKRRWVYHARA